MRTDLEATYPSPFALALGVLALGATLFVAGQFVAVRVSQQRARNRRRRIDDVITHRRYEPRAPRHAANDGDADPWERYAEIPG